MRIGSQIHSNDTSWDVALEVAKLMDAGPWHSVFVPDHFVPPLGMLDEAGDCFEGWTFLTALGAATERLRLGVLVSGNTYRNPSLLAKMAATLDHISHGRVILGIGAAWHKREHEAYGWNFPAIKERCDRLEEAAELIRALLTGEGPVNFEGRYYRLDSAPFAPKSVQQPHLPIMIGGNGERRTLKTLAQHGDIMNLDECTPAEVERKLGVLNEHCRAIDRDPGEIEKSAFVVVALQDDEVKAERLRETWGRRFTPEQRREELAIGSAEHIVEVLRRYQALGIEHLIFKGVPNNPRLYQRLTDEVVGAFA